MKKMILMTGLLRPRRGLAMTAMAVACAWQVSAENLFWAVGGVDGNADGDWDYGTLNWTNDTGVAVPFKPNDIAYFSHTVPVTVTIVSNVMPMRIGTSPVMLPGSTAPAATDLLTITGGIIQGQGGWCRVGVTTIAPIRIESEIVNISSGLYFEPVGTVGTLILSYPNEFTGGLGVAGNTLWLSGPSAAFGVGTLSPVTFCSEGTLNVTRVVTNAASLSLRFGETEGAPDRIVLTGPLTIGTTYSTLEAEVRSPLAFASGNWIFQNYGRIVVSGDNDLTGATFWLSMDGTTSAMSGMTVMNHSNAALGAVFTLNGGLLGWGDGVTTDVSGHITAGILYPFHVGKNHVTFAHPLSRASPLFVHGDPEGVLHLAAPTPHAMNGINLRGGTLLVDMENMDTPVNPLPTLSTTHLFLHGGTLHIKGKAGVPSFQTIQNNLQSQEYQKGTVILEAGTDGTLEVDVATINTDAGVAEVVLKADTTLTLRGNPNAALFPHVLLHTEGEYSLARTVNGTLCPVVTVPFAAGATDNFLLTGNALNTAGSPRTWSSLTIDPVADGGVLDLDGAVVNGGPILHRGAQDYTVDNGAWNPGGNRLTLFVTGEGNLTLGEGFVMAAAFVDPPVNAYIMTKAGTGRLVLKNAYRSDQSVQLCEGSVEIWRDDSLGTYATPDVSVINVCGEVTIAAGADTVAIQRPIYYNGPAAVTRSQWHTLTLEVEAGKTLTLEYPLNGKGHLVKTGAGTAVLAAANPFVGSPILKEGTLSVDSLDTLGAPTRDPLLFRGGMLQITGTAITTLNTRYTDWESFNGGIDVADALNAVTIPSTVNVATDGIFCKGGAGALFLDGGLDLNGGTLAADGCPDFCPVTVAGTLDLTGCTVLVTGTPDALVTIAR
ncbi:MAG: hypothetical protein FWF84_05665, partial [Kiritimatiellaeota bacterium]|nr:hypothetical protein [Kiritimatiellota bacterium]